MERRIEGGSRHLYRLALDAGDFLHLEVEQRGVDVVARLAAPDGTAVLEVDSPSDDLGPEVVRAVAARTGEHSLEVEAFPGRGGRYVVTVAALRPATDDDRARAAAAAEFAAAEAFAAVGDAAAEAAYRRAGDAWRRLGDPAGRAHAEDRLGRLATRRRDPATATGHHRRAAALFAAAGEERWRGISLTLLGTALFEQGELRPAGRCWEEALALRRAAGDTAGEARLLHNLGHLGALLGEPARALESYERSLERRRQRGEEAAETLHNLGVLLLTLGRTEDALDRLYLAEAAARRTGDERARAGTLLQIGRAEGTLGRTVEAAASFELALDLARRTGDRRLVGQALSQLGLLAYRELDLPAARRRHEEALAIYREIGDLPAAGAALTILGAVELAAGDPAAARERFVAAAPLLRSDADPWHRAENLHGRARAEALLGRLEPAREAAEAAVELVDSPRRRLGSLPLTASYSATVQPVFDRLVEVLMALHRRHPDAGWDRRALAASERGRARSFLDAAALARAEPPPAAGDPAAAETALRRRLDALDAERLELRRNDPPAAVIAALEREVRGALAGLERLGRRRRAADPRQAAIVALAPLTPERIRRALPADAALIEIELTAESGYLWVVTADGVESHELGARRELEAAARSAYELLRRSHRREAEVSARRALCRLSRKLLAPASTALARRRLLVVAEGALLYLPFAALPHPSTAADGGGCSEVPLAATHAVVQLPSASLLAVLAAGDGRPDRSRRGEIAIVGDPAYAPGGPYRPLPFSREEAEAVLAAAPAGRSLALLGPEAGREAVLSGRLEGFRRLHFAAHGVVDPRHPELSGLVLSTVDAAGRPRAGFLRAHDIAALDLDAELVTLSACRTALGAEIPGEGLVGLTRSFFEAGARAVLVSLWSVDDRSTAELMRRFYGELFAGRPPAEALARAQAAMAAEPAWEAPYRWAGFVLQGPFDP